MKKLIILLLLLNGLSVAQTTSNVKPKIFITHDNNKYFNTSVYYVDSVYVYQMVKIQSYTEIDMLNALLDDYKNRIDKNVTFVE